jgi:carbon storage regulator
VLVLSRRVGESIMIGPDVVVTVLEVRPDLVRIGIKAPRDVEVHREEVFIEVQQANRSAASPSQKDVEALAADLRDKKNKKPDDARGGAG